MFDSAVILVAEADDELRSFIAGELEADAARVLSASFPAQALARAAAHRPHAMVLGDLGTIGAAVEAIRAVRRGGGAGNEPAADLRILTLVDEADELAVLRAFHAGADDVADRAVAYPVLRARLMVLLDRAGGRACQPSARVGPLDVSLATRQVWLRDEPVELSGKEFALLSMLASEPARVFTRAELLREIWGFDACARTRTLDSHASRLRGKLRVHGDQLVVNVWGVGYRLIEAMPGALDRAA